MRLSGLLGETSAFRGATGKMHSNERRARANLPSEHLVLRLALASLPLIGLAIGTVGLGLCTVQ